MCIICFGTGSNNLSLRIHARTEPEARDVWSANWLHCTAEASAGKFYGAVDWQLRNEDLQRFVRSLETLNQRIGEAQLDTGDGWLDVRVIRDDRGNIEAQCHLGDNPLGGNSLDFRLQLNEQAILDLISQLRNVLQRFPVIGVE
jgi:hypothetical protein